MQRRRYERAREISVRGGTEAKLEFTRELRREQTPAESLLWAALRRRRLGGLKFRRQHLLLGFVADFYCPELRLVIEVDGSSHEAREEIDAGRSRILRGHGVQVLRVTNREVLENLEGVLQHIAAIYSARLRDL